MTSRRGFKKGGVPTKRKKAVNVLGCRRSLCYDDERQPGVNRTWLVNECTNGRDRLCKRSRPLLQLQSVQPFSLSEGRAFVPNAIGSGIVHQQGLFVTPPRGRTPTTLDPLETSVDPRPAGIGKTAEGADDRPVPTLRHAKWAERRARVYRALVEANVSYSRREAFRTCGSSFWVMNSATEPTAYMLCPDHCHDRFCEPCQSLKSRRIREALKGQLTAKMYRFLTLTIRSTKNPLKDQLEHLYRSFRRLRGTKLWRRVVDGGIAFLELTFNTERGEWHPHLHCILAGKFIPVLELRAAWEKATKGSHVLDIKLVRDKVQVATYVSKYATKAYTHREHYPQSSLIEAIGALKGRRTVVTFGTQAPLKSKPPRAEGDWVCVCHAHELTTTDRIDDDVRKQLAHWVTLVRDQKAQPRGHFPPHPPPVPAGE